MDNTSNIRKDDMKNLDNLDIDDNPAGNPVGEITNSDRCIDKNRLVCLSSQFYCSYRPYLSPFSSQQNLDKVQHCILL